MAQGGSIGRDHGPGWTEVRLMMQEIGAANDCRIDIHCSAAQGVNRSEALVWSVRAFQWGVWGEKPPFAFVTGLWPQHQYATVPGMLYRLLHELDGKLEAVREQQRRARQRGLFGRED